MILAIGALFVGGCGSKDSPQSNPASPTRTPTVSPGKIRVEFRSPESGERLRRHIYAPDGITEVELQIEYTDGHMAYQYYREDSTLKELKETYPGVSTLRHHAVYDADGKTILSEQKYRLNGKLETELKRLADGTKQTVTYRADGKQIKSIQLVRLDSSIEETYYRKDGSLWAKVKWPANANRELEYYDTNGKLEHRRVYRSDGGIDITVYRADGTVGYKQSWTLVYGGWFYREYTLGSVEEYQANGTTSVRKLVFGWDGKTLRESHLYNPDGTKASIRYFRSDGTLERQDFLDKAGKVTRSKTHNSSEGLRESLDPSQLKQPEFDDPSDPRRYRDDD
jgi:hypothetical protein